MSNTLIQAGGSLKDLSPIVVEPGSAEEYNGNFRSYDFSKGDRRFLSLEDAIEHGNREAAVTGVRQTIRLNSSEPGRAGRPFHLVQAVGS